MAVKTTWNFTGVPLVRVQKRGRKFYVQMRSTESSDEWKDVTNEGNEFDKLGAALDAAPGFCEF